MTLFGPDLFLTDERIAELDQPVTDEQFAWLQARGRLDNGKTFAENQREARWERIPGPMAGKCGVEFLHISGWSVMHCGHPTALWPYYLLQPDRSSVVSFNGRGFKSVAIAQDVVERIVDGGLYVTTEGCVQNLARVNASAFGEMVSLES